MTILYFMPPLIGFGDIEFYPCPYYRLYVRSSCIWLLYDSLSNPEANHSNLYTWSGTINGRQSSLFPFVVMSINLPKNTYLLQLKAGALVFYGHILIFHVIVKTWIKFLWLIHFEFIFQVLQCCICGKMNQKVVYALLSSLWIFKRKINIVSKLNCVDFYKTVTKFGHNIRNLKNCQL